MTLPDTDWLTVSQVARLTGLSRRNIEQRADDPEHPDHIPAYVYRRSNGARVRRFAAADIAAWMAARRS